MMTYGDKAADDTGLADCPTLTGAGLADAGNDVAAAGSAPPHGGAVTDARVDAEPVHRASAATLVACVSATEI